MIYKYMKRKTPFKKTCLNPIGKTGRINIEANRRAARIYDEMGKDIRVCEAKLPGCWRNATQWHHRYALNRYISKNREEWINNLSDYNTITRVCIPCHEKMTPPGNKTSEDKFEELRP